VTICPCCGQPTIAGVAIETLRDAPLSAVRRTIVNMLERAYPREVSAELLISEIYRGSHEPQTASEGLIVQISILRKILPAYGWTIPKSTNGRSNTGRYRLELLK
jgi:hypothetical protein